MSDVPDPAGNLPANDCFPVQASRPGRRTFLSGALGIGAAGAAVSLAGSAVAARASDAPRAARPSTARLVADGSAVSENLGLLSELAGSWEGEGFVLIARPDFHDGANLYLQLNQTRETLTMVPIGSAVPDRGFGQDDIDLFGLSYLQQISDRFTGANLHLEPGLWMTQPATTFPPESPPGSEQLIVRMATIPHGNAVMAQGSATTFSGAPVLAGEVPYTGSLFPAFNSTVSGGAALNAAGTSEKLAAAANPVRPFFAEYDLGVPASASNPRTPFGTSPPEPPLPQQIDGVSMQDIINDPVLLLQSTISKQVESGCSFESIALNFATVPEVTFHTSPNLPPTGPTVDINVTGGAGGIMNTLFLQGEVVSGVRAPNAETILVYGTLWIENVTPRVGSPFIQLQYVQSTLLSFPVFSLFHPAPGGPPPLLVQISWPHISVATLRKSRIDRL